MDTGPGSVARQQDRVFAEHWGLRPIGSQIDDSRIARGGCFLPEPQQAQRSWRSTRRGAGGVQRAGRHGPLACRGAPAGRSRRGSEVSDERVERMDGPEQCASGSKPVRPTGGLFAVPGERLDAAIRRTGTAHEADQAPALGLLPPGERRRAPGRRRTCTLARRSAAGPGRSGARRPRRPGESSVMAQSVPASSVPDSQYVRRILRHSQSSLVGLIASTSAQLPYPRDLGEHEGFGVYGP